MARRRRRNRLDERGYGTLNITPLLDVIFNLIFFFILATTIRTEEAFLEVQLPSSTEAPAQEEKPDIPVITVTKEGDLALDGDLMSMTELEENLAEMVEQENVSEVIISSDAEITYQRFVDVTDLCRRAGIRQVSPRVETQQR